MANDRSIYFDCVRARLSPDKVGCREWQPVALYHCAKCCHADSIADVCNIHRVICITLGGFFTVIMTTAAWGMGDGAAKTSVETRGWLDLMARRWFTLCFSETCMLLGYSLDGASRMAYCSTALGQRSAAVAVDHSTTGSSSSSSSLSDTDTVMHFRGLTVIFHYVACV